MNKYNSRHINHSAVPQPHKEAKENDSRTDVNIVWDGPRGVHSFRGNNQLWEAFVSETKARGDSVCHFLEALIAAVLGVIRQDVYKSNTITIENLSVQRVVGKPRRVYREFMPEVNMYDPNLTDWVYVPDTVLNKHGHASGCKCSVCSPFKGRS